MKILFFTINLLLILKTVLSWEYQNKIDNNNYLKRDLINECSYISSLLQNDKTYQAIDCCTEEGIKCENDHIVKIDLSYKQLTGSIPKEIGNLSKLHSLYLSHNQLTGSIPPEIGNLKELRGLDLSYNELSGSIPKEIGNIPELEILYLHNNQLTGSIPDEVSQLSIVFGDIKNNNKLSGDPPKEYLSKSENNSWLNLIKVLFSLNAIILIIFLIFIGLMIYYGICRRQDKYCCCISNKSLAVVFTLTVIVLLFSVYSIYCNISYISQANKPSDSTSEFDYDKYNKLTCNNMDINMTEKWISLILHVLLFIFLICFIIGILKTKVCIMKPFKLIFAIYILGYIGVSIYNLLFIQNQNQILKKYQYISFFAFFCLFFIYYFFLIDIYNLLFIQNQN